MGIKNEADSGNLMIEQERGMIVPSKRIILYSINFAPELTGIGKYNGEMVQWLTQHGYEVRVITAPPYYPQWKVKDGFTAHKYTKETWNGAEVWRCPIWVPTQLSGLKRLIHLTSFAFSSIPVVVKQMWWRPHVIIVVEPPLVVAPIAAGLSKLFGVKSWLHVQDFEVDAAFDLGLLPEHKAFKKAVTTFETWLMRRFDIVSSISKQMIKRLYKKGIESTNTRYFPNWVDTSAIFPLQIKPAYYREQLGISMDDFVVLYSGNLGAKQGLEIIVEAAEILRDHRQIHFVICGEGSIKDKLMAEVERRKLTKIQFISLQPSEKLNTLLNSADVHALIQKQSISDLVMPSKLTGMLASGVAVIATAVEQTAVDAVIKESLSGRSVTPENPEKLANAILEMSLDKASCAEFGLNARAYAVNHLSIDFIMGSFEKSLSSIISGKKKAQKAEIKDIKEKGIYSK